MEWVRFNFGDWALDTRALSLAQEGAYLRLLCAAYDSEKPLTADHAALCKHLGIKSPAQQRAALSVLERFFVSTPEGWTHSRVLKEITYAQNRREKKLNRANISKSESIERELANDNNGNIEIETHRVRVRDRDRVRIEGEAIESPAPNGSPMANLFTQYTAWLSEGEQIDIKQARTMLAKWRNQVGDAELGAILLRAQDKGVSGPIAWITAAIKQTRKKKERIYQ